jgi:zinc transport system permease protein
VLLAIVWAYHRQLLAVVFDEEHARLRGIPASFFYLLLLVMVALTVVLLIQVVGLILVLALITLPAAMAGHYVNSLHRMMWLATLIGMLMSFIGLAVSYPTDLPTGPVIVLVTGLAYVLSSLWHHLRGGNA